MNKIGRVVYKYLHEKICVLGCPDGWTFRGRSCYKHVSTDRSTFTWLEGRDHCLSMGGTIMNIDDEEELQLMIDTYSDLTWSNQRRGIWLGGKQIPLEYSPL